MSQSANIPGTMEHMWDLRISNQFHRGVTEPPSKNTRADDISVLVQEGGGGGFCGYNFGDHGY